MTMKNNTATTLFLALFTFIFFSFANGDQDAGVSCRETNKQALLSFTKDLRDPSTKHSSSWDVKGDCCNWTGVVCHNSTGQVLGLDLSDSQIEGNLPPLPGILCNLTSINLSKNNLTGKLQINSSACREITLQSLILDENQLSGNLPDHLGGFTNLKELILGINQFSGAIPDTIGSLKSLERLIIDGNQLNGSLPETLGRLSKLQELDITDNLLEGSVSEVHFAGLTNLSKLYASRNRLSLRVSPEWIPPFQLKELELASWDLGSNFPQWLRSQSNLGFLDLSSCGISGTVPPWFWNSTSSLYYLSLSNNQIRGEIPYILGPPDHNQAIYLSGNQFSGPLPRFLSNYTGELDLSNNSFSGEISNFVCDGPQNVLYLNLRQNLLSGEIPNCWTTWDSLRIIDMGNNNLTGDVPSSMGTSSTLISVHLRNNSLSGDISLFLCGWRKFFLI